MVNEEKGGNIGFALFILLDDQQFLRESLDKKKKITGNKCRRNDRIFLYYYFAGSNYIMDLGNDQ